jgi:hypothetical protein
MSTDDVGRVGGQDDVDGGNPQMGVDGCADPPAAAGSCSGARTWWLQGGIGARSLMIAPAQHHQGNELFLVSKDCIV